MAILLPRLHKNQQIIFEDKTRFRVVAAGRRFGKSREARVECLDRAINKHQKVWWLSPSYGISDKQWRETKRMLTRKNGTTIFSGKSEQGRRLEFYDRESDKLGELSFKSGDRPDNLRGEGLDFVVIDEAAFVHPDLWYTVIRPALVDTGGSALFISTPNGRNWFYKIALRGQSTLPEDSDWNYHHFTSYDNLAIKNIKQEVDDAKRDMPENRFRQEHLAEFVDDVGALFKGVSAAATSHQILFPEFNHVYSMGIDWGRKHDATVITVIDITDGKQVYLDRFTETGWEMQKRRVKAAVDIFKPVVIYAEENNAGQPVIEALQNEGITNIVPFVTTGASKGPLIDNLSLAIERQTIQILSEDDPMGELQANELKAYTFWQSKSGNWQYGAPYGFMDDTVIALALALLGTKAKPTVLVGVRKNPFYNGS
jgi:hypothetical protein